MHVCRPARRRSRTWLLALGVACCLGQGCGGGQKQPPAGDRVMLNAPGAIREVDLATGGVLRSIPTDDGAGRAQLAVAPDARTVFVVDGPRKESRLRIYDLEDGRLKHEESFENRALSLGGVPLVHLTADGRYLLIHTFDLFAAASGVAIFEVGAQKFRDAGMRGRPCPAPRFGSAQDGTLVAACPGSVHRLAMDRPLPDEFAVTESERTPVGEVADLAVDATRGTAYVLEICSAQHPWHLVRWPRGSAAEALDLRRVAKEAAPVPGRGGQGWLAVAPDGRIAVLLDARIWLLGAKDLRLLRSFDLPWFADGVGFSPDGAALLTVRSDVGTDEVHETAIARISLETGAIEQTLVPEVRLPAGPGALHLVPGPRRD